jgi:hypothetical protein
MNCSTLRLSKQVKFTVGSSIAMIDRHVTLAYLAPWKLVFIAIITLSLSSADEKF